jgi:hypothetical protein
MKKVLLLVVSGVLALSVAQLARADASFTDPAGDSGTAPDITAVTAANDATGANLTFTVRTNQAALAADAVVFLYFDADQNGQTGSNGVESVLLVGSGGWEYLKWNGSAFAAANAASANASYANGLLTFKITKADMGGSDKLAFWVDTAQFDAADNVIAQDTSPDGDSIYEYTVMKPLTLRAGATTAVPAAPKAGKSFVVRTRITRGDTGGPLASGAVKCTIRIGTVAIRATGRVAGGVASCTMTIPKTAKGKTVRGTMKVTLQGVSTSKTFSYKIK